MWELDYKESWTPKNWCFWTVVLEKTLESPLDCKEIQPVHPKGNQSWIFIGRTDAEAETPILWPTDADWHWKRPWCWERLKAGEGADRGWDDWMASPTRWTWVWVSAGSWWWTGKPGVLQSMGLQSWTWLRDWTDLSFSDSNIIQCSEISKDPLLQKFQTFPFLCLHLSFFLECPAFLLPSYCKSLTHTLRPSSSFTSSVWLL